MPSTQHTSAQPSDHVEGGPRVIDGYQTTGSSPGRPLRVHVIGLGPVGREVVNRIPDGGFELVGLSDRSATVLPDDPGTASNLVTGKASGRKLSEHHRALTLPIPEVLIRSRPDVVVDATHTASGRDGWHDVLEQNVLRPGRTLVFASKDAVCARGPDWIAEFGRSRVRFNAVLGGTGQALGKNLPGIAPGARSVAIAGNASTTTILDVVETGGSFEDGLQEADRRGYLEPDPELDLNGADAAVKLGIVAGLLSGCSVDPDRILREDIRSLDVRHLRRRRKDGYTTRLVGRWEAGGRPLLRYESLPLGDPLAVPASEVVYRYDLVSGSTVEHRGGGLGAGPTADAVVADLIDVASELWTAQARTDEVAR